MPAKPHSFDVPTYDFNEKTISTLLFGGTDVDCPTMELRRATSSAQEVYKGPGFLRSDEDGQLLFKIYPTGPANPNTALDWLRASTAGQLIDRRYFHTLTATDWTGQVWTAEGILPNITQGPAGFSIQGNLRHLDATKSTRVTHNGSIMQMLFLDQILIPCNAMTDTNVTLGRASTSSTKSLDLAEFSSCGCDFLLRSATDQLLANICSQEAFPLNLQTRMIESLQFVLARSLYCRFRQEVSGQTTTIRLTSAQPESSRTMMPPPLHFNTVQVHQNPSPVWQMFDAYLRYVLAHPEQDWHPCSIHVHKAREASANSLDARALGLSIAVEGVVKLAGADLGKPSSVFKAAVRKLKDHCAQWLGIEGWDGNDSLKSRAGNLLSQLCSVRAVDRLYALAENGSVQQPLVEAWKALRNPTAHAEIPDTAENQRFVDHVMAATVLLYQLVFSAIGYTGPYSDYATRGFPVSTYPPSSPQPPGK